MFHCVACGAPNPIGLKKCYHCKQPLQDRRHRDAGDEMLDEMDRMSREAGAGGLTAEEREAYRQNLIDEGLIAPEAPTALDPSERARMPRRVADAVDALAEETMQQEQKPQDSKPPKRLGLKKLLGMD